MEYLSNGTWRMISLGQPLFAGAPHYPTHPPYIHGLTRLHGERSGSYTSGREGASDSISLGTHVGTHVDGLVHISEGGKFHGGTPVDQEGVQSYGAGIHVPGLDNLRAMLGRGILLDFAALEGVERVPHAYAITPELLQRCLDQEGLQLHAGDVVLIRTGWDLLWNDPGAFVAAQLPGPNEATARMLSAAKILATGSDTIAYEIYPHHLEVHGELLVRSGIPIMECLNLSPLARECIYEFQFIALPLNIDGATGSPINPLALVPRTGA